MLKPSLVHLIVKDTLDDDWQVVQSLVLVLSALTKVLQVCFRDLSGNYNDLPNFLQSILATRHPCAILPATGRQVCPLLLNELFFASVVEESGSK